MKKSFLKIVMLLTAVVLTFSCKDYDDDIDSLQKQINAMKSEVTADFNTKMEAKIASLQAEITGLAKKIESGASKDDIEAAKKDLLSKVVTLESYKKFQETIKADLDKNVDGAELKKIQKEINDEFSSLTGRLAVLEGLLNIKDGKIEGIDISELGKKIEANKAEIMKLKEASVSPKELQDLLNKLDVKVAGLSGTLSNVVLYPENYVMGVESVVLRPIVFGHNWENDYVVADENGVVKKWGAVCPCKDCTTPTPDQPTCPMPGNLIKGHTKDKKVFVAHAYMMPTYVKYNVSPANIDKSMMDVENLEITSHLAAFTRAGGVEDEGENPFTAKFVSLEKGKMTVELNMNTDAFAKYYLPKMTTLDFGRFFRFAGYDDDNETTYNTPVLALQIPHSKEVLAKEENSTLDPFVTSDYVNLYVQPYFGLDIARKKMEAGKYTSDNLFSDYIEFNRGENVPDMAYQDNCGVVNAKEMPDAVNVGTTIDPRVVKLVEGKTLNLIDYVQSVGKVASRGCAAEALDITKYGLAWKFDLLDEAGAIIKFIATSNKTNQQEFITLSDEDKGTISARVVGQNAAGAAVDRTPIVRVRIIDPANPDCYISQAFIKVLIIKEEEAKISDIFVGTYLAKDPEGCNGLVRTLTWQEVNENIYNGTEHKGGDLEEMIKGLGISKEEFVKRYGERPTTVPVEQSVGSVIWVVDNETETGRTTYVPKWEVTLCELDTLCQNLTYTDVVPVKSRFRILPKDVTRYPAILIDFNGNFSKPSFTATDKDLNIDYWNAAKTEVEHHSKSQSPAGNKNSDDCTYRNNLNSIFRNPNPNYSLNLPGVGVDKYEYKFVEDVKLQYVGKDITMSVEENGKKLFATKDGKKELIASIIDHTATNATDKEGQDFLEYADTDLAKELLNKGWRHMWARIQLTVECEGCTENNTPTTVADADPVKLPVSINGKDSFVVYFLRPINAKTESPEAFEDGVRFGLQGSILDIEKVVALEDWHKEKFSDVPSFYDYYGVNSIKINTKMEIQWDSNGVKEKIPSTLKVHWIPQTGTDPDNPLGTETGSGDDYQGNGNYKNVEEIKTALGSLFKNPDKFNHGALTYFNNGTTVKNDFYLYVPLEIEYKWGVIATEVVKIKVKKTEVQEDK